MNVEVVLDEETKNYLIDKGFDPKYGARPLKRTIQSEVEDRLAEEVLSGTIKEDMRVDIHTSTAENGSRELVFTGAGITE